MASDPPPHPQPRPTPAPEAGGGQRFSLSPSDTSAVPIGMPREIGPYQIQRLLGSGGMATVYAALQRQPRRTVALKVMKAGIAQSRAEAALRRFKREIEILGKLHHPYIAAVYDAGTYDDGSGSGQAPYFVMEYISGALNILEYIAKKDINLRDRLKLFVKVCAAVEHGHSHKVIHRDLKPGNILIDQYGEPKIIDFGIAHAAEVDSSQQTMTTEAGNLVGTLQYMAPEQVDTRPQDLDGRCDVYALGVLLYKMTTGKPPYDLEALPVFEAIRIIREEQPRRPSDINSEVKGDLETIILKAMERDRARRYRNAGSLGRDIVRFLANKPINARPASIAYRTSLFLKRNAAALSVTAVIALVAISALGYTTWERQRLRRQQAQSQSEIDRREAELAQQQAQAAAAQRAAESQASQPTRAGDLPIMLQRHTATVNQLTFITTSEGALRLLSASLDHQLISWDVFAEQPQQQLDPLGAMIMRMACSLDGSLAACIGNRGDASPIVLTRTADNRTLGTIRDTGGEITALAMSASGSLIAWGADNLTLNVRAAQSEALERDDPRRTPRLLRSTVGATIVAAISNDERMIAAGSSSGSIVLWRPYHADASTSSVRLAGLRQPIVAITFARTQGSHRVHALAEDGEAHTWSESADASTGWSGESWLASTKPIIAAAFSANGSHLALASADGLQVWALNDEGGSPQRVGALIRLDDPPAAVAVDDAGRWLAAGMHNGDIAVYPLSR